MGGPLLSVECVGLWGVGGPFVLIRGVLLLGEWLALLSPKQLWGDMREDSSRRSAKKKLKQEISLGHLNACHLPLPLQRSVPLVRVNPRLEIF